ncbi:MAG TPA: pyridoxal-phosphate dependent enzyme, partial [Candidatus Binatia bacterium]|nr:pyridoxal-phosphate dependent enzyme [Candidatus Binatia bacterium]
MQYAESILDLVGNTPLVRLTRIPARDLGPLEAQPLILAKLEALNPGGSVKDRIGLPMIEAAEREGLLKPGGTIIEPTSGNTGHGLAIAAALKGYRCIFVMADKQSTEKQALLRAYGAEVVLCPTNVEPESPESYYSVAARLARDIPGAFKPDQYWNQENPNAHERTTGPEIWEQTEGRITHLVVSVGTGGTVTGTGRYLRKKNPDLVIVGADPEGSVLSGDTARPYLTEGIGEDFFPGTYDPTIVDRWVRVSDRDAFTMARRITREEGILAGESCGTAVVAVLDEARRLMREEGDAARERVMVVILPDGGRSYLSKLYNDEWMRANGLLTPSGAVVRIEEVLGARPHDTDRPNVVIARTTDRVGAAIDQLQLYGISQLPVSERPDDDAIEAIIGSVSEKGLLDRAYRDPAVVERTVGEVMD